MLPENFRRNVRAAREHLGLTQLELAERLDVSAAYICQVESGRYVPGIRLVEKMADALGVAGHELLMPPRLFLSARNSETSATRRPAATRKNSLVAT